MTRPPCVATVPDEHAYLDAVLPRDVRLVRVPGDGPWAPSPLWAPGEVGRHPVDVVHVHFGFDHLELDDLRRWVAELPVPLVLTVHDLRNPHHADRARHDAHLDVLVPAAAAVLTLTPGAAAEIEDRWGRVATVVPHPAVLGPPTVPTEPGLVGVHLKSLRRNVVEPDGVVAAVLAGVRAGGGRLQVDVHPEAVDDVRLAGVRALARAGALELAVHPRHTDHELAAHLATLHVSVLPHRFGTHSGWLEACRDSGTAVVAPSCGFYAQQWEAVRVATHDEEHGLDAASLTGAVADALGVPAPAPAHPVWRGAQREQVRATHFAVYRSVA